MDEFAKMIYRQWAEQDGYRDRDLYFKNGEKLVEELEAVLSYSLNEKIYETFCNSCYEIEQNAFIAGFSYACKCLSNGKIEFSK